MQITSTLQRLRSQPIRQRYYQAVNAMLVPAAGRALGISHVVEYPKCGGSWVRRMLETYLHASPYHHDRYISRNTVIQLHRLYSSRLCNPIVLYRDPRDVFVSYYFYERNQALRGTHLAITGHFDFSEQDSVRAAFGRYLRAKLSAQTDPYFSYREFHESWSHCARKCVVTYEGFHRDAVGELGRAVEFLGFRPDPERIAHAVAYNTFEQVTRRKYGEERGKGVEDNSKFQRKGVTGDWVNYFDDESSALIERELGDMMKALGYQW